MATAFFEDSVNILETQGFFCWTYGNRKQSIFWPQRILLRTIL